MSDDHIAIKLNVGQDDGMTPASTPEDISSDGSEIVQEIYDEIIHYYKEMGCPWVIGYSGGKDSSVVLQMIWYAIRSLKPDERIHPIYVVASDTLVENPSISLRLLWIIKRLNELAIKHNMPLTAEIVPPDLKDSFWVNLIGRGYPAPTQQFRWCTERLKIRPITRAIEAKRNKSDRLVIAVGTRFEESNTRKRVMEERRKNLESEFGGKITRHPELINTYVYSPIEELSTHDVWLYLLTTSAPWDVEEPEEEKEDSRKTDNELLYELYRDASGGECPLVITDDTEPCGGSRFGCWTCTLVKRDTTAETLFERGQSWLKPLLDIRKKLTNTQPPEEKKKYRDYKRRTGGVNFHRNNPMEMVHGPYYLWFRKEVLKDVLEAQAQLRTSSPYPDITLISLEELKNVRRIWRVEEGDWEDSVRVIYREVFDEEPPFVDDDLDVFDIQEKEILSEICEKYEVPLKLILRLIELERELSGFIRRTNLKKRLKKIINEEWRPKDEILEDRQHLLDMRLD